MLEVYVAIIVIMTLSSLKVSLRASLASGGTVETHHSLLEILKGIRINLR